MVKSRTYNRVDERVWGGEETLVHGKSTKREKKKKKKACQ
jgi:hypothetical protein